MAIVLYGPCSKCVFTERKRTCLPFLRTTSSAVLKIRVTTLTTFTSFISPPRRSIAQLKVMHAHYVRVAAHVIMPSRRTGEKTLLTQTRRCPGAPECCQLTRPPEPQVRSSFQESLGANVLIAPANSITPLLTNDRGNSHKNVQQFEPPSTGRHNGSIKARCLSQNYMEPKKTDSLMIPARPTEKKEPHRYSVNRNSAALHKCTL